MVYQDISSHVELKSIGKSKAAAQIVDRFFSFIIDYLVISPFVMFTLYFAFNNGFLYAKSNPQAAENDWFYVLMGFCYFILFSLIQTLFIAIWQATPGQHFLKLKLDFGEETPLNLLRAFCRQLAFWSSFLLLGLPLLSVLTNKRRRTFYDQLADVSVVSLKDEKPLFDFESEFKYWRALLGTLSLFFGFVFVSFVWSNYDKIVSRSYSFTEFRQRNFFCEDLRTVNPAERMEVAIGLNLVDQLSDSCLDREADFVLWKQKYDDYALAYFAKSLTASDSAKEQQYLTEACSATEGEPNEKRELGCRIASAFKDKKFEELYEHIPGSGFLSDVLKYELGEVLEKNDGQADLFAKLDKYGDVKGVRKYRLLEMLTHDAKLLQQTPRMPASVDGQLMANPHVGVPDAVELREQKIIEAVESL